jgi:hypothetical protein
MYSQISFLLQNEYFYLLLEERNMLHRYVKQNFVLEYGLDKHISYHCRVLSESQFEDIKQHGGLSHYLHNINEDLGWGEIILFSEESVDRHDSEILKVYEFQGRFSRLNESYHIINYI